MKKIALALVASMTALASPASAAPVVTTVGTDVSVTPFTFSFLGNSFTFGPGLGFASLFSVATANGAAVRSIFGSPSTDFTDRETLTYDQNTLGSFDSYSSLTPVSFTNGNNFLGLRATSGEKNYYGFAYTTDNVLNSYGFETTPEAGITATTVVSGAVPEPATWAMMLVGFGSIGFAMRRRKRNVTTTVAYA